MSMQTEIIRNYDQFKQLKEEWDEVLSRSHFSVVFLTHEWLSAWWEEHGRNCQLFIVVIKLGGKIQALAPLMLTADRKLQFIGHEVSDYLDLIIVGDIEECFRSIFAQIVKYQKAWDWAEFIYIADNSPYLEYWKAHVGKMGAAIKSFNKDCVSVYLDMYKDTGSWEELEKQLPAKRRNDLKRCDKLLRQLGKLSFTRIQTAKEIEASMEGYFASHKARWKKEGQGSQFDDPVKMSHYLNIVRQLAPKGWIELASMKLNDDQLALAFGYTYNDRYYYYTPTFNPAYAKYSPGNLLIKYLIGSFYEEGKIRIFDLLRGAEKYKYVWSRAEQDLYRIRIYRFKVRSLAKYVIENMYLLALPFIKRLPYVRQVRHILKRITGKAK